MALLLFLGCTAEKSPPLFWFLSDAGEESDLTEQAKAGTETEPASLLFDEPGQLSIGPGTWFLQMELSASIRMIGDHSVLSAAGTGVVIDVTAPSTLTVENLAITGGYGCLGAAIRAAILSECTREAVTAVPIDLFLKNVDIYGNDFDTGGGAVGVSNGSTVSVESSIIHENKGHAIYGMSADVTCTGDSERHFGLWDNDYNGVMVEVFDGTPHFIESNGCDFGVFSRDNGHDDVGFGDAHGWKFGNDVSFRCDSDTLSCH